MGRHAWAGYVDSADVRNLLWRSAEALKVAWQRDLEDPKRYPLNTSYTLAEIFSAVTGQRATRSTKILRLPKPPKRLAELISERIVKAIWEENHSGRFEDAIAQAAAFNQKDLNKSWKIFQSIIRAIESAYLVDYVSLELLQRPKVNILHKGLNEIANAAGIGDQTEEGFAEFLDDLCPCGLKKHREAVRKLSSRSTRMRRPKP